MKKIAVIQDLSGLGKCSLTAAIPVISVMGVQAVPLPTAVLSNQTGYSSYYCDDYTEHMEQIMTEWEKRKFSPDGIYTGFLADEEQADKILDFFQRFRTENTMVLVDPVMGDNGRAYGIYTEGLREKMLQLVGNAHVITPNLTEALLLLYGKEGMEKRYASLLELDGRKRLEQIGKIGEQLKKEYGLQAAVITGVESQAELCVHQMGNLVVENGHSSWCFAPKIGGSYSGTGDLFASVLSAGLVKEMSMMSCVELAVNFLSKAIAQTVQEGTDRNDGVCFEAYLGELCKS
ncbi:pyridoxamine kinase [Blautia glucerasea]|uniref:pyridoxamine kinase n=1 Tax=Blautia glucerasea TaxID=536633 RepID=UPI00156F65CA|nr:pyridoxamine kinase [Blautia glucerasea]NSD37302.1 pyridoxamine kinase [Blautia glucerasea]